MASSARCNGGGVEEIATELTKPLKDGERILAPTRRPDGTLRKPIRIRAGYVPQEEVAIYQPKGALIRKEMGSLMEVPPGYVPVTETIPKSKSAKRNERKKEKCQQGKALEKNETSSSEDTNNVMESVESVASQMNGLSVSEIHSLDAPLSNSTENLTPVDHVQDIDKKIRALKKKIRQTEAQQQKIVEKNLNPEQLEKLSKLESWREELKLLEYKKAEPAIS